MNTVLNINLDSNGVNRNGDSGIDPNGGLFFFFDGEWLSKEKSVYLGDDAERIEKRKFMYERGIREYQSRSGFRMHIRDDGSEYIDKRDMPA